jgi:Ca2+-binding RTX toxin-like protein
MALWTLSIAAATPAFASSCVWDDVNFVLTVNVTSDEPVTIGSTGSDPSTDSLTVTGPGVMTDCTQPLDVLDMVDVNGSAGSDTLTMDLSNGFFPNMTNESGQEEVEFDIDLLGGVDTLYVSGGSGIDQVELEASLASSGVNPNASVISPPLPGDSDIDWFLGSATDLDDDGNLDSNEYSSDIETIVVRGNGGNDNLDAGGVLAYPRSLRVEGGADDDWLRGGKANDVMQGGDGADEIRGSTGNDFADYTDKAAPVVVDIDTSQPTTGDDGTVNEQDKVYSDIENLRGGSGNDDLTGNSITNVLEGVGGADTLNGGFGNDVLRGGIGNDEENGEEGSDVFDQEAADNGSDELVGGTSTGDSVKYTDRTNSVEVSTPDLGGGDALNDDGEVGEGDDVHGDIEKIFTGSGADTLRAAAGTDHLFGGSNPAATEDLLFGGEGNDILVGGPGDDEERGQAGSDTFYQESAANGGDLMIGSFGTDTVRYRDVSGASPNRSANVTVTVDNQANDGQSGEGDNVRKDIEKVYGGDGNDTLTGDENPNRLFGLGGNDTLRGLGGNDTLTGSAGNDNLQGGTGNDVLSGGDGDDTLSGGDGRDRLTGNAGADDLNGGGGASDYCTLGTGGATKTECERD